MKISLLIILCVLIMYLTLAIQVSSHAPANIRYDMHACRGWRKINLRYPIFQEKSIVNHIWQSLASDYYIQRLRRRSRTLQFFHYARSMHCMIKMMWYDLHHGDGLNFRKGRHIPLQLFVLKDKPVKYYDQIRMGLRYVTPPTQSESDTDGPLPLYFSDSSGWKSDVIVGDNKGLD